MVRERLDSSRPVRRSEGVVRTCVGCRKRAAVHELLRVVAKEQESGWAVIPDPRRQMPGRGAHLHPTPACLDLATGRRGFPRALRVQEPLAGEQLRDYVAQQH